MIKFIQVGRNDGCGIDDKVNSRVMNEGWRGVFVEPNPRIFDILKNKTYKDIDGLFFQNVAIRQKTGQVTFYFSNVHSTHSSLDKNFLYHVNGGNGQFTQTVIPAMNVNDLIAKYDNQVDYLFVDTQGFDVPIIMGIDFKRFKINNIIFQHRHTDGPGVRGQKYFECISYLRNNNYVIRGQEAFDTHVMLKI